MSIFHEKPSGSWVKVGNHHVKVERYRPAPWWREPLLTGSLVLLIIAIAAIGGAVLSHCGGGL
jgi:hypothetical protein